MNDLKLLFLIVATFGLLAAGWWFGWFGGVTKMFKEVDSLVVARPN